MVRPIRRLVSTNKRRIHTADGKIDIDASWVLPGRLLALGYPSSWPRSVLRNPLGEVSTFLLRSCNGAAQHWRVFNLCIENGWQYEASSLLGLGVNPGCVVNLPLWDGQAPPCHLIHEFCVDAATWLATSVEHKVAVHCKAGKGRTGALIAALLLYMAKQWPAEALPPDLVKALTVNGAHPTTVYPLQLVAPVLAFWGEQRTTDGKGLTISSQRRYVSYYAGQLGADAYQSCDAHRQQQHDTRTTSHDRNSYTTPSLQSLPPRQPLTVPAVPRGGCTLHTILLHGLCRPANAGCVPPWSTCQRSSTTTGHACSWMAPDICIAVWLRAPGEHTPRLMAYTSYVCASSNSTCPTQRKDSLTSRSTKDTNRLSSGPQHALQRLPLVLNCDTGDLELQLGAVHTRVDHCAGTQQSDTTHGSSVKAAEEVKGAGGDALMEQISATRTAVAQDGCQVGHCQPTARSSGHHDMDVGGVVVEGDIKVHVLSGALKKSPPDHALFRGGRSIFYAWLNTAHLDSHTDHALHSARPGSSKTAPASASAAAAPQVVSPSMQLAHGVVDNARAAPTRARGEVPQTGVNVDVALGSDDVGNHQQQQRCVTLRAGELDKLQKKLRDSPHVALSIVFTPVPPK